MAISDCDVTVGSILKLCNVREVEAALGYQRIDHTVHDGNKAENQDGVDRLSGWKKRNYKVTFS